MAHLLTTTIGLGLPADNCTMVADPRLVSRRSSVGVLGVGKEGCLCALCEYRDARYLEVPGLKLPRLAKVLEFERAATASLVDGETRIVRFDFEPLPLLRALAEGRLPSKPEAAGEFEIEITGDGPAGGSGLDVEALRHAFPFH
jgi:hypothetical protein